MILALGPAITVGLFAFWGSELRESGGGHWGRRAGVACQERQYPQSRGDSNIARLLSGASAQHDRRRCLTYGFLMSEHLLAAKTVGGNKNFVERQVPTVPEDCIPRDSPARAAPRRHIEFIEVYATRAKQNLECFP